MPFIWKRTSIIAGLLISLGWLLLLILSSYEIIYIDEDRSLFFTLAFQVLMFMFVLLFSLKDLGSIKEWFHRVGFKRFPLRYLVVAMGMFFIFFIINFVYNLLVMIFVPELRTQSDYLLEYLTRSQYPWSLYFLGVLSAPIVEELYFRGFLYRGLAQHTNFYLGAVISSLIFSLLHGIVRAFFPIFILGIMLSYLYKKSGSIIPGIFLHFVVNSIGAVALYYLYTLEVSGNFVP